MIKDTVNNIHVSAEDVLITPEALSAELPVSDKALAAKLFLTLFTAVTTACLWYAARAQFTILKRPKPMRLN